MNMNAEQMLTRCHIQLMRSKEFCLLSGVLMCGKSEIKDDSECPTAYTDGWNCYYGREFFSKLNERERNGVVLHENFHKLLRQLTTWNSLFKESAQLANMAADYVVNGMIEDMDPKGTLAVLPEGALVDPQYKGLNTKQVFDLLKQQGKEGYRRSGSSGEGGNCTDEHGWGEATKGANAEEQAKRDAQIDQALRQGQILAGKMGSGGNKAIDELLKPKVNWRELLHDFVNSVASGKDDSTWRRPSRRGLASDTYLPSSYSESLGEIVVAIDTSGSVGGKELSEFVAELVTICDTMKPEKLTLLWWDTRVAGVQEFSCGEYEGMVEALKPKGGGGTDFSCVTVYLDQRRIAPDCMVVLTDGYVSNWGNAPSFPVLFGITGRNISAPYGVSVHVEGD